MSKKNYQIVIINYSGQIIHVIKSDHIDCVTSHSIFYNAIDEKNSFSIFDDLESIVIRDKKVILQYPKCRAEITQI
jgi:hypothetical protein